LTNAERSKTIETIARVDHRLGGLSERMGAVNIVDIAERKLDDGQAQRLASIVESSDDAIFSEDLDGVIASWNGGAQRIFGYSSEEMIGRPASVLIPPEREDEEPGVLERLLGGERIDHYDTVRRRKDGSLVEISLTVSPLRNSQGAIIAASKIARDITERRRAYDRQQLVLRAMDHRIRNLFSVASSIVALSAQFGRSPAELTATVRDRLGALARAHSLTLFVPSTAASTEPPAMLHALIRTIVSPYENGTIGEPERVTVKGANIPLSPVSLPSLALLLHELTTNAAKFGALSTPGGRVDICCELAGDMFTLRWTELGGPAANTHFNADGFGGWLIRAAVEAQFGGVMSREWLPEGLAIGLSLPLDRLAKEGAEREL
jgi:PAS domain S-box-containing protein